MEHGIERPKQFNKTIMSISISNLNPSARWGAQQTAVRVCYWNCWASVVKNRPKLVNQRRPPSTTNERKSEIENVMCDIIHGDVLQRFETVREVPYGNECWDLNFVTSGLPFSVMAAADRFAEVEPLAMVRKVSDFRKRLYAIAVWSDILIVSSPLSRGENIDTCNEVWFTIGYSWLNE